MQKNRSTRDITGLKDAFPSKVRYLMQRKHQAVRTMLFLALIGSLTSCTDSSENLSAPPDNALDSSHLQEFQIQPQPYANLSGKVRFSAWQTQGQGFAQLGAFSAPVEGKLALASGENSIVGPAIVTAFSGDAASRSVINTPSLTSPTGNTLLNVVRASGSGGALRINLGGPTRTDTLPDGRELRVEFSPLDSGDSTREAAFYIDNKLMALNFFTYGGKRPLATAVDVVHFHEAGGIAAITNYDLTEIDADLQAISEETLGVAAGVRTLSGPSCETQRVPDPDCEEGPCTREWLDFMVASAAWLAAGIAFDVAVAGCPSPFAIATCPAAIGLGATLSAAAVAVAAADYNLRECRDAANSGSGGGGSGGTNCRTYYVEVSYDDGATWHHLRTVQICD